MYENGVYRVLLTDEQFDRCKKAVLEEPDDEDFNYFDGLGSELLQDVEEAMTNVMYVRLLFAANYDYENFLALSTKNKGYEFALSELSNLKSIDSDDEFMEFIDFIAEQ